MKRHPLKINTGYMEKGLGHTKRGFLWLRGWGASPGATQLAGNLGFDYLISSFRVVERTSAGPQIEAQNVLSYCRTCRPWSDQRAALRVVRVAQDKRD